MEDIKTLTINGITYAVQDPETVRFTKQELTDEQKKQARENIGVQMKGTAEVIDAVLYVR